MKPLSSIRSTFRYNGQLPEVTQVKVGHVIGALGQERVGVRRWKEHPHLLLANLPTGDTRPSGMAKKPVSGLPDEKAMEEFVRTHGVLWGKVNEDTGRFDEDTVHFADAQDTLRKAWTEDSKAIQEIKDQLETALEVRPSVRAGGIEFATENLWSFLCLLFLRDNAAGRTKVCANPDCTAPYYLAKRKDQRFCARGECTAYAQRQYTLKWWHDKGQDRRTKLQRRKRRTKR